MVNDIHNYKDIMGMKRPNFNRYPKMSMRNRAGQFAPFAALTGHMEAVDETARETDEKLDLDESVKSLIDYKLQEIKAVIGEEPELFVCHFVEDLKKDGGSYENYQARIIKIDEVNRQLIFKDGRKIAFEDLYDISFR